MPFTDIEYTIERCKKFSDSIIDKTTNLASIIFTNPTQVSINVL